MPNVVVKDNHLTFGGVSYFRGHAEEIMLGAVGRKRVQLLKQNYLEVRDRISVPKMDIAKATVVDIDFSKTTNSSFRTVISAIVKGVPVRFSGDSTFQKLRSGELKLVKFSVTNNAMKDAANNSPQILRDLIEWGPKARIAHQIFVVMEASLANEFDNNVTAELSAGVDGIKAEVGGGRSSSGRTEVQISQGTCFAYLLAKIEWNAKRKKKKSEIINLRYDQWSLG